PPTAPGTPLPPSGPTKNVKRSSASCDGQQVWQGAPAAPPRTPNAPGSTSPAPSGLRSTESARPPPSPVGTYNHPSAPARHAVTSPRRAARPVGRPKPEQLFAAAGRDGWLV